MNASPEAADGGGLALIQTGDKVRIDLKKCTADMLVPIEELKNRAAELEKNGGFPMPESQSPWQQYFREMVQPFSEGMVLRDAPNYKGIAQKYVPRNNH